MNQDFEKWYEKNKDDLSIFYLNKEVLEWIWDESEKNLRSKYNLIKCVED